MNTTSITASNLRLRRSFARTAQLTEIPNLIALQKRSYESFLQKDMDPDRRGEEGLNGVFKSVFPISDFNNTASLEFVSYTLEPPKYDVEECRQRGMTFASPVKVTLRLIVFDVDEETEARSIRDVKEQEVYLGEIPLMTANGSFIVNGTERVVVSQLHRSPGVFFDHDGGKASTTGKLIYSARVIPYRGSWLDFEFDQKDLLYVRIDRRRKFPVTILLKALGYDDEQLLDYYYDLDTVKITKKGTFVRALNIEKMAGQRAVSDLVDPKTGDVLVKTGRRITRAVVRKVLEADIKEIELSQEDIENKIVGKAVVNEATGEVIAEANSELTPELITQLIENGVKEVQLIFFDGLTAGPFLRNTLLVDKVSNEEEALLEIYKRMRPGEPPTIDAASYFFKRLFFEAETPYREVTEGSVGAEIKYTSALEEQGHHIAQAGRDVEKDKITADTITVRVDGEYERVPQDKVSLMDVSPSQLVSIAASLIPFLEHDDANRALMGSNMQRQAVPLLRARAPLVGTGVEKLVARDSGTSIVCTNDGIVEEVDASRIVVRRFAKGGELGGNVDIYNLTKYQRTNQNTCFNQKPIVFVGDRVKKNDIIADGPSTELGELALGQNILVAFTPWMGYNFEDSILISERLIKEDVYTSIHIEEFECIARDTKLGKEEITRDIANVGEEALSNLDASGVIRVGAEVTHGDILVGKVTPKGETQLSPEEKLLRAIFGEKAGDVRDTSLRVPSGVTGTVIDAQVYSREGSKNDVRLQEIISLKRDKIQKDMNIEQNVIRNNALDKLKELLVGKVTNGVLLSEDGSKKLLEKNQTIADEDLETIPFELLSYIPLESELEYQVTRVIDGARNQLDAVKMVFDEKLDRLNKGDELPPGVIKMVKVYIAIKRKLQVGDKFAGRHGNKGVVSRVLPAEDMPYMADGTPVDMVLNPLGVPSRMNIGQVLEVHLGWAAHELGKQLRDHLEDFDTEEAKKALLYAYSDERITEEIKDANEESVMKMLSRVKDGIHVGTPVFDGAKEVDVKDLLARAKLPSTGQTVLFDGRTGEPFQTPVTVGIMYMLKLHHLVEEKIHARSIGPYSLVSQQPLGGKAQFGGQRLGEMEVWAIEAYGAAYSLQEFLTVKSDDVAGRTRMYESIVKGENILEPGLPESFNVLVKELQSLALNVDLVESDILTESVQVPDQPVENSEAAVTTESASEREQLN